MRRDEAILLLTTHREFLISLGVKSLNLFGSVARDEAKPERMSENSTDSVETEKP
jgi:hypothetical protein